MRKEYLVIAQQAYQVAENKWTNVRALEEGFNKRYYGSLEDAKVGLKRFVMKHNKDFAYDMNGKRRETTDVGGGFGADMIIDKKLDDDLRVVAWKIRVREVTEWEEKEAWQA